jgi:hypothetical protein
MTSQDIKQWVVMNASVTRPTKNIWSASVTLGIDVNGLGETIEKAYVDLAECIEEDSGLSLELRKILNRK